MVALIFFSLEKYNKNLLKYIHSKQFVQSIISVASIALGIFMLRRYSLDGIQLFGLSQDKKPPLLKGILSSLFLFLMIIGEPNYVTRFFGQSQLLRIYGKYSFGVYLFHPIFIYLSKFLTGMHPFERIFIVYCLSLFAGFFFFSHLRETYG